MKTLMKYTFAAAIAITFANIAWGLMTTYLWRLM